MSTLIYFHPWIFRLKHIPRTPIFWAHEVKRTQKAYIRTAHKFWRHWKRKIHEFFVSRRRHTHFIRNDGPKTRFFLATFCRHWVASLLGLLRESFSRSKPFDLSYGCFFWWRFGKTSENSLRVYPLKLDASSTKKKISSVFPVSKQ